ncbi:MAG: DUF6036 family nucleotidyltransferase [Egibacteraceae bacterium]
MDREEILDALHEVGQGLLRQGLQGDLYVVGGAAIALAYNTRRVTRDIDAVFEPKRQIYAAAAVVAADRGLDADWLNDSVKGLLRGPDPYRTSVFDLPGLRVEAASPQMLLALKVLAHRINEDRDDVRLLAGMLGLGDADQVLDHAERLLAPLRLTIAAQLFVEEVMAGD